MISIRLMRRSGSGLTKIDGEQAVGKIGSHHLHAVGQQEAALELAAAMPRCRNCRLLSSPDDPRMVSWFSSSVISSCSRAKPATASVIRSRRARRRCAASARCYRADSPRCALGDAVERALDIVEAEQERMRQTRRTRHTLVLAEALERHLHNHPGPAWLQHPAGERRTLPRLQDMARPFGRFKTRLDAHHRSITMETKVGLCVRWYSHPGLNGGPLDPQSSALTN
jgi:hypothetical protein